MNYWTIHSIHIPYVLKKSINFDKIGSSKLRAKSLYLVTLAPEGQFLVTILVNLSLEGECHEVEVAPYLKFLVTFGMSLQRVFHELFT